MKNKTLATLGLLALLATASAFGQPSIPFDIPFEFSTGATVMPAGHYTITQAAQSGLKHLECYDCKVNVLLLTRRIGSSPMGREPKLVFNKYGDTYFLSAVWSPDGEGSALPESKIEHETALRAALTPTTQVVLVARR